MSVNREGNRAVITRCQICGGPLPESTDTGRPRRFCSDRCRSRAHRVRQREAERTQARLSRRCEIEVAGHRCDRGAVFVLAVDERELKVCPACRELALAFLVGQGASATAVETRRFAGPDAEVATPVPSAQGTVLLIEDDHRVVDALSMALRRRGYEMLPALTGGLGLAAALEKRPEVVLLDLGLPDIDGIALLRTLRAASDVPVIVTTARGEIDDKILGLDNGADDYLVKPYDIEELVARMRRVVRQRVTTPVQVYDDGVLRVDLDLEQVLIDGTEVRLSRREFRLLDFLVRRAGTAQPIRAIIAHVWHEYDVTSTQKRTLAVLIAVLRTKLGAVGPNAIVTAHGIGYYYQPPARRSPSKPAPRIGYSHAERLLNPPGDSRQT